MSSDTPSSSGSRTSSSSSSSRPIVTKTNQDGVKLCHKGFQSALRWHRWRCVKYYDPNVKCKGTVKSNLNVTEIIDDDDEIWKRHRHIPDEKVAKFHDENIEKDANFREVAKAELPQVQVEDQEVIEKLDDVLEGDRKDLSKLFKAKDDIITSQDEKIEELKRIVALECANVQTKNEIIRSKDEKIAELNRIVELQKSNFNTKHKETLAKDREIAKLKRLVESKVEELLDLERPLEIHDELNCEYVDVDDA